MDKREQILDSALKLFVERGFHATPTSAITNEAGMSSGILFHYFPTKDDLIISLYIEIKKEFFTTAFSDLDKIKSDEGKLRLLWSNSWNWGLNNPLKFRFLQQADNSTYHEAALENPDVEAHYQFASTFIQQGIDKKFLKEVSREYVMMNSFSLITAMIQYLTKFPEKRHDSLFIEQAWDSFIDCLKK